MLSTSLLTIAVVILVATASFVTHAQSSGSSSSISRCDPGFLQSTCPADYPVCCFQPISQIWAACCAANSICDLDEGLCITYPSKAAFDNATANSTATSTSYNPNDPSPFWPNSNQRQSLTVGGFDMTISVGAIVIACSAVVLIIGVAGAVAIGMWASLKYDLYRMRQEQEREATESGESSSSSSSNSEASSSSSSDDDAEGEEHHHEGNNNDETRGSSSGSGGSFSARSGTSTARGENNGDRSARRRHHHRRHHHQEANNTTTEEEETPSGAECILCYTYKKDTVLLPCGHMVCCHRCSDRLADRGICAICRKEIRATVKVPNKKELLKRQRKLLKEQQRAERAAAAGVDKPSSSVAAVSSARNNQQQQEPTTSASAEEM